MRLDQIQNGLVVQFRQGNGTHTGTVKSIGRNGNDEHGSEVVIGDIYPHIYDQPTVTKHGLDLLVATAPNRFNEVSNSPLRNQTQERQDAESVRLNRMRGPAPAGAYDARYPDANHPGPGLVGSNYPAGVTGPYVDDPSLTADQNLALRNERPRENDLR
jgi:hypothetical protein